MYLTMNGEQKSPQSKDTEDEKPFSCSGCGKPLGKLDEYCSNCERINPNYILR